MIDEAKRMSDKLHIVDITRAFEGLEPTKTIIPAKKKGKKKSAQPKVSSNEKIIDENKEKLVKKK